MQSLATTFVPFESAQKPVRIENFGIGAIRFNSAVVIGPCIYASQGVHIVQWDIESATILHKRQVSCSVIYQVVAYGQSLVVIDYAGFIFKLDLALKQVGMAQLGHKQCRFSYPSAVRKNVLLCDSDVGLEPKTGYIDMVCLDTLKVKPLFKGSFQFPFEFETGIVVLSRKDSQYTVLLLDEEGKTLKTGMMLDKSFGDVIVAQSSGDKFFYAHQVNKVSIVDSVTLEVRTVEVPQSSCLRPYSHGESSGVVTLNKQTAYFISGHGEVKQVKLPVALDGCYYFHLKQSQNGIEQLIAYNESGLHFWVRGHLTVKTEFQLTNCGLAVSPSKIATGDLAGFIYFIDRATGQTTKIFVGDSIRCLVFGDGQFYLGGLGGTLARIAGQQEIQPVVMFENQSITCLRWGPIRQLLWGSTTNGRVFSCCPKTGKVVHNKILHQAKLYEEASKRQRFGSMKHRAEIWSLCLSPDQQYLATASEDQTVGIVSIGEDLNKVHTITGHSLAVTSVAWQRVEGVGQILVSCSDDKFIRFYDPKTYIPVKELCSSSIGEWHTLTYLAVEREGHRLVVGTQIGHLLVYDLREGNFVFCEKEHLGGVEGLCFERGTTVSVSSDLVVCVAHFQ